MRPPLKSSETQIRLGIDIYLGRTYNDLCPVIAMLQYLAVRCFDNHPLFLLKNGTPLSRKGLVEKIKTALAQAGIDSSHYSGNSFRIGAATTAAACSVSDATIQLLGRWKSGCYTRYIRPPHQELATTACSSVTLNSCPSCVSCHAFV